MHPTRSFEGLTDATLLDEVARLARNERDAVVLLIASLGELDRRRLYLGEGFGSLFAYCTQHLRLGEGAAYRRIEAARAARRFPDVLEHLAEGRLTLASLGLLVRHLTETNHAALLEEASFKTKREVEQLIARLHPQPPVPSVVRKLPDLKEATLPEPSGMSAAQESASRATPMLMPQPASRRPIIAPLSGAHYKLQITLSSRGHERLRAVQDLMRHTIPNGDPALIVERALELLHDDLVRRKTGLRRRERADG